jgi:hypothetical protein
MPHRDAVHLIKTTHPLLKGVGWRHRPRGRTKEVVDLLCGPADDARVVDPSELDAVDGLPSNAASAAHLGMSEKTVKDHIAKAANEVNGLSKLRARARIYICYLHDQWESSPHGKSSTPIPQTGTTRVA